MDLQADVKAYLETLTEEQRAAWMVNLQLSYASRTAPQASHSSEPSQSVASLPMTHVERRAEKSPQTRTARGSPRTTRSSPNMPKPNSLTPRRALSWSLELRTSSTNTSSLQTMALSNNRKRSSPTKPQPSAGDRASGTLSLRTTSPTSRHDGGRASATDIHGATSRSPSS